MDLPERYVRLCLRLEPHIEGFIDAYVGPPEWREEIGAEHPADPAALRDEASALLADLDDAGLEADRTRWLRGQLEALECAAAVARKHRELEPRLSERAGAQPLEVGTPGEARRRGNGGQLGGHRRSPVSPRAAS